MTTADEVRALVEELADVPLDDAAPLAVDSLTLVQIVEAIEDRFGIRVAARDVVPASFGSLAAICNYVESKRR